MLTTIDPIDKWHLERKAKFTSSENYKLCVAPPANKLWSPGAVTYIEEKAIQAVSDMWDRPALEEVGSLLYGRVHEYPAFECYVNTTRNNSMQYLGTDAPLFLTYDAMPEESGGTPDAISVTDSNKVDVGCEIKCPANPVYHFRRLKWKSQFDIKEGYPLVYCQIQHLLLITGAQEWHFVSFDDRQQYKPKKIKIIEVKPDKKFQDNLHVRLEMAIKEKYKLISEHYEVEVKNRSDLKKILK